MPTKFFKTKFRYTKYYLESLAKLNSGFSSKPVDLQRLKVRYEAEIGQIKDAYQWLGEEDRNHPENHDILEMIANYPNQGIQVLFTYMAPQERIRWLEFGFEAAKFLKDDGLVFNYLSNLVSSYADSNDYTLATEFCETAQKIAEETQDYNKLASILNQRGSISTAISDYPMARSYLDRALAVQKEHCPEDERTKISILSNLGILAYYEGYYEEAIQYHQKSIEISKKQGDKLGEAGDLARVSAAYLGLDAYEQALLNYHASLKVAEEVGDWDLQSTCLGGIAQVYTQQGKYSESISYREKCLAIEAKRQNRSGEANALGGLALNYFYLGDTETAIARSHAALEISRAIGHRHHEAMELNHLGIFYAEQEDYDAAIDSYEKSLELARSIGDISNESDALGNYAALVAEMDDLEKALELQNQSLALSQKIGDKRGEASSLDDIGSIYLKLEDFATARSYYQKAVAIYQAIGDKRAEAVSICNIGVSYANDGDYWQSFDYYYHARKIFASLGLPMMLAWLNQNLCFAYEDFAAIEAQNGNFKLALEYFQAAILIQFALQDKESVIHNLQNLNLLYRKIHRNDMAKLTLELANFFNINGL